MIFKVCEIFRSLQGEGPEAGKRTIFVRLSGCNLECAWCDTQYHENGKEMGIYEVLDEIKKLALLSKFKTDICFTGGEPLLQKNELHGLIGLFTIPGHDFIDQIYVETNGTILLPKWGRTKFVVDYKLPSAKPIFPFNVGIFMQNPWAYKFVIADTYDYVIAQNIANNLRKAGYEGHILFSPCMSKEKDNVEWLATAIIEDNLDVRFSLQIHKIIWGDKRGV